MEDYKRKYEEALENLKKIRNSNENNKELVDFIEYKYPEIKESEDEKIKKTLINFLDNIWHLGKNANFDKYGKADCAEWIVWLEKQDPKKHEEELEKAYKTADEVQYRKGYEDAKREFEKQGEQKFTPKIHIPKFRIGDTIKYKGSDSTYLILNINNGQYSGNGWGLDIISADESGDYELFDQGSLSRSEQNPNWSEEDEKMLNYTISTVKLHLNDVGSDKKEILLVKEEIDWLKSIKERYTWKPSDEQIKALNYVINLMASSESPTENDYYYNVLKVMRTQLKKLR